MVEMFHVKDLPSTRELLKTVENKVDLDGKKKSQRKKKDHDVLEDGFVALPGNQNGVSDSD